MPAHNAAKTIGAAVKSTLRALPADAELLIFLDGCTDRSEEVLTQIEDVRLRVIKSDENVGVAAGLNHLLDSARGKYIARMDADDVCLPGRFRRQVKAIEHTGSDFVFSNAILFGKSIPPLGLMPQAPLALTGVDVSLALIFGNPFVHPTMFARAASINGLGGYRNLPAEDYDLWLRASAQGSVMRRINSFGILYRVHKAQLTSQLTWQKANDDCLEVRNARRYLALRALGTDSLEDSELGRLLSEIIKKIALDKPITSRICTLTKLIGIKATFNAMISRRVKDD